MDQLQLRREDAERHLQQALHHLLYRRQLRPEEPRLLERRHGHLGKRLPAFRLHLAKLAGNSVGRVAAPAKRDDRQGHSLERDA
ncbi:hypothetical protein D3C78_1683960 [compost metagenome]